MHEPPVPALARKPRKRRGRRFPILKFWPNARVRRRWWRNFRRLSVSSQVLIGLVLAFLFWLSLNYAYQVMRKPTELFFPLSGLLFKTPYATWDEYGPIFEAHSTAIISPDLLAALAQVEGSGNPVARTYWRWSLTHEPFEVYRPASSAVGVYQITDGTYEEASRYCIHDHIVVEEGPLMDLDSCWFNSLYLRVIPSHAAEMTSAYLDRRVVTTLRRLRIDKATLQQKQDMAAVIHLCGAGAGEQYAKRRFRTASGQRCGDHDVQAYVARINQMRRVFQMQGQGTQHKARGAR